MTRVCSPIPTSYVLPPCTYDVPQTPSSLTPCIPLAVSRCPLRSPQGERLEYHEYIQLLKQSKLVLSPWGWGEWSHKVRTLMGGQAGESGCAGWRAGRLAGWLNIMPEKSHRARWICLLDSAIRRLGAHLPCITST